MGEPKRSQTRAKPKESLVDWVVRATPALQPAPAKLTRPPANVANGSPRYIPLTIWAELLFGEHGPHYNTLLRWAHEGRIQPQAKKIGRKWFVVPNAEYVGD